MKFDPQKHHRRSIRLRDYDYSQPGEYFVTIVSHQRECLFGEIADEMMVLNDYGRIVDECWRAIPSHFENVELGAYVVMPNHLHGIITINDEQPRADADASARRGKVIPIRREEDLRHTKRRGEVLSPRNSGETLDGETLDGETLDGETLGGETLDGETLGGETLGGETLGGETPPLRKPTLGQIVAYFKYGSTKRINILGNPGLISKIWQRNYFEHIIRDPDDLNRITLYIESNSSAWLDDEENPNHR